MRRAPTPTLDLIAAHGNRGHNGNIDNSIIICRDGAMFAAYAGGEAASTPRTEHCTTVDDRHRVWDSPGATEPCDYPGPYTELEVFTDAPDLLELGGLDPNHGPNSFTIDVHLLRLFMLNHGGEYNPVEDAEDTLRWARRHDAEQARRTARRADAERDLRAAYDAGTQPHEETNNKQERHP